jgi:hypothetical protein
VDISAKVTLKFSGVSVRAILDHLTRPLGLSWLVRDGVVLITSRDDVDTYLTTRIYPVPDLMPPGDADDDEESLLEVITNTVKPESWSDAGGRCDLIACESIGCLVCVQTRENHEATEKLLAALRRDGAASAGAGRPRPMVLRIYTIGAQDAPRAQPADKAKSPAKAEVSADDVAKIVRELVAPETWDVAGGKAYFRPLGNRLIVRQTPRIHREISSLLLELGLLTRGSDPFGAGGFF